MQQTKNESSTLKSMDVPRLEGICLSSLVHRLTDSQVCYLEKLCATEKAKRLHEYCMDLDSHVENSIVDVLGVTNNTTIQDFEYTSWVHHDYLCCRIEFSIPIDHRVVISINLTNAPWFECRVSTDMFVRTEIGTYFDIISDKLKEYTPLTDADWINLKQLIDSIIEKSKSYTSITTLI